MFFTPLAIGAAGFVYLFSWYCSNSRPASTDDDDDAATTTESDTCCWGFLPRTPNRFAGAVEESIPLRRPGVRLYSSTDSSSVGVGRIERFNAEAEIGNSVGLSHSDSGDRQVTNTTREGSPILLGTVYDFHHPLIVDSNFDEGRDDKRFPNYLPDLFSMSGSEAVEAYSDFVKASGMTAQGPEVVVSTRVNDSNDQVFNKSKSTSLTGILFIRKDCDDDCDDDMDDFDARYRQRKEKFFRDNNLTGFEENSVYKKNNSLSSGTTERKVSFNSLTKVRAFSVEGEN